MLQKIESVHECEPPVVDHPNAHYRYECDTCGARWTWEPEVRHLRGRRVGPFWRRRTVVENYLVLPGFWYPQGFGGRP